MCSRYVESRDDNQLLGRDIANPSDNCDPFSKAFDKNLNETLPVVPCGVIANSLFNDTFKEQIFLFLQQSNKFNDITNNFTKQFFTLKFFQLLLLRPLEKKSKKHKLREALHESIKIRSFHICHG